MVSCQVCQAQAAKPAAGWTAEDFLRQDVHGKRLFLTLHLCAKCTRFVTGTFGDVRGYLVKQLPPDLVPTQRPAKKPARARPAR